YLLRTIGPIDVLVLRLSLASAFFAALLAATTRGWPRFKREDWGRLALVALLGVTINTSAIAFGTRLIPAAVASLIVTSNPVFTALISRALMGEPLTRRKLAGIAVAFVGFLIVLLYGGQEARFSARNSLGVVITLLGPLAWAFYTVLSKPLLERYEPTAFAGIITIVGTAPLLPLLALDHSVARDVTRFGPPEWLATLTMTVLALVLAYTLWYRGLRALAPTQVAVYIYLVPVFGALGAWLLLGERITVYVLVGGLTILGGVVLTNSGRRGPVDAEKRSAGRIAAAGEPVGPAAVECGGEP
ncbi:MAG: DMT family transporter, partial [Thermomicrobiaceae bacterium]|nr:DMT family transporter [Thermomicrobiaceae bacterium]